MQNRFRNAIVVLALALAACTGPAPEQQPAHAAIATAPDKLWPLEMASHVEALARAGRLDEARIWYFRGGARSLVWDALAQSYASESFNRGVTPFILRLSELEPDDAAKLQFDAIAWEASAPLDLPDQFPRDRIKNLPEIRKDLAKFIEDSMASERSRRAGVSAIRKQVESRKRVDEAVQIIPESDRNVLIFSSAAYIACDFGGGFAGGFGASSSASGRLVAIDACNTLRIVDMNTGSAVQAVNQLTSENYVLAVYPEDDDLSVLSFKRGGLFDSDGFFRTTSKAAMEKVDLPAPKGLPGQAGVSIGRSVSSKDGKVMVLEWCKKEDCSFYAAYDLPARTIIWEARNPSSNLSRLVASVIRPGKAYVLVSELRPLNGPSISTQGTELLNLTTGDSTISQERSDVITEKPSDAPICHLSEQQAADRTYLGADHVIAWPGGRADTVLKAPVRIGIYGCSISPDAKVLLIAAPPFIYRYDIRPAS